ncbi:MAG: methyl-accepting chemotaxis protein [Chloroflexi bacterium]|nr:MAG: methyl-accepting chemotaxis protein [Chloroflexota bacterium]
MKWIAQTSIYRRLFFASLIVAVIPGLIIFLLAGAYMQALGVHGQAVRVSADAVGIATAQLQTLQQMNADLATLHAAKFVSTAHDAHTLQLESQLNSEINTLQTLFGQILTKFQQNYLVGSSSNMGSVREQLVGNKTLATIERDQQNTLRSVMSEQWPAYLHAQNQLLQALKLNQPSVKVYQLLLVANERYTPLEENWTAIVALAHTVSDDVTTIGEASRLRFTIFASVAFLAILCVVVIVGYVINLTITRPLHELAVLTQRISKGDSEARITIRGSDEIQEAELRRDELQGQIEKLVSEVRGIGEGDLQVYAEVMPGMLQSLANFFNNMVGVLGGLIIRVKIASREVETSTVIARTMLTQLVNMSTVQLQEIAEATVKVKQMTHSSRLVADRTHKLDDLVRDTQTAIQKGRLSVQRTVDGMKRIHENVHETAIKVQKLDKHSSDINQIITVISTISQQMNHLAHDAAVQASRVGEHGKGFGVVAGDILRLAERTTSQVSSIARIVQGVHEDIGSASLSMQDTERESSQGAKLAEDAEASLKTIFAAVEHQARGMDVINQMTTQQLHSFNALEDVMQQVSQSTQHISASARRATQNLEYLARQVEELRVAVEVFKLREVSQPLKATFKANPVTPIPAAVPRRFKRIPATTPLVDADAKRPLTQGKSTAM